MKLDLKSHICIIGTIHLGVKYASCFFSKMTLGRNKVADSNLEVFVVLNDCIFNHLDVLQILKKKMKNLSPFGMAIGT